MAKTGGLDPFSVYIPPLLMQPIVENAIVHGLSPKQGDKKLVLNVKKTNGHICITVEDNGIGRNASARIAKVSTGKGLRFTKERLDLISEKYGAEYKLDIHDMENEGTRVEVCFLDE